jgi:hypothetical protein
MERWWISMILELIRLEESYEYGTFGVLKVSKQVFCVTLEPRDQLNAPFISSIPAQQYMCRRYSSTRYGQTWLVEKVPDRQLILFHPGNIDKHTEGCILLGEHFGKLRGDRAVLNSGVTFRNFMTLTRDRVKLHLTIREVY